MSGSKGRKVHNIAGHLREGGDFIKSLQTIIEALDAYIEDKDYVGVTDAEGDASLSLRHLYKKTKNKSWLFLSEAFAQAAVKIAQDQNLQGDLARPLFNLAKVQEELGDFTTASKKYREAITIFEEKNPSLYNRSGVLADMKIHAATCEYKAGDNSGIEKALDAIEELKNSGEEHVSKYNYDVWLSGGHMRIAEILKDKEHLEIAKKIIDSNPDLVIRKEQWEELAQSFT